METKTRSIYKTITWRLIATATTMSIVYALTGSFELMGIAGALDMGLKLLFYFLHERAWSKVEFGYNLHKMSSK